MTIAVGPVADAAMHHLTTPGVMAPDTHFQTSYHLGLVGLSYLLAGVGSFAALAGSARVRTTTGGSRLRWLTVTAVALGGGAIWSMHFVGMLAYHIGADITFALPQTLLSLGIAIMGAGIGLAVVGSGRFTLTRLAWGGLLTGLAIAAMHYTGMAAMRTAGTVSYRGSVVVLSVVIAVIAAIAAFWITFRVDGVQGVIAASAVMGLAVCGMHYTAMAATLVTPEPGVHPVLGFDPLSLGLLTAFASSIVLLFIIFAALGGLGEPDFTVAQFRPRARQHRSGTGDVSSARDASPSEALPTSLFADMPPQAGPSQAGPSQAGPSQAGPSQAAGDAVAFGRPEPRRAAGSWASRSAHTSRTSRSGATDAAYRTIPAPSAADTQEASSGVSGRRSKTVSACECGRSEQGGRAGIPPDARRNPARPAR